MIRSRARSNPPTDLLLLFRPINSTDTAVRLARAAGRLLMLAGVVVVLLGFLQTRVREQLLLNEMLRASGFQDIRITPRDESRKFIKD